MIVRDVGGHWVTMDPTGDRTVRLSRRSKPWVRDDLDGDGKVEVTGYRFVDADTGMVADNVDRREWLAGGGAVICYAAGVGYLDGEILQSDGLQTEPPTLTRPPSR